jgi:hypothetical protein
LDLRRGVIDSINVKLRIAVLNVRDLRIVTHFAVVVYEAHPSLHTTQIKVQNHSALKT